MRAALDEEDEELSEDELLVKEELTNKICCNTGISAEFEKLRALHEGTSAQLRETERLLSTARFITAFKTEKCMLLLHAPFHFKMGKCMLLLHASSHFKTEKCMLLFTVSSFSVTRVARSSRQPC